LPPVKALLLEVSFFEAHFRAHYTETTRISYPAPLPTSVAGIFGAMLGWGRQRYPDGLLYGAKISRSLKPFIETVTYHQFGPSSRVKGVAPMEVLSEPAFVIAVASGDPNQLEAWSSKLSREEYEYLPYGGQNDFFVKDIGPARLTDVAYTDIVEGYAPSSIVEEFLTEEGSVSLLPVSYRKKNRELFAFPSGGAKLQLKQPVPAAEGIPLYPLEDFYVVVG